MELSKELLETLDVGALLELERQLDSDETRDKIWKKCKKDIWYWLETYVKTENHHREETVLGGLPRITIDPFPRMKHHEMIVSAYWKPDNVVVMKSRDMMLTWTVCAIFLWDLLFTPRVPMFISTYQDYLVDDGGERATTSTLMGRIQFMYRNLPQWMQDRAPLGIKKGLIRNTKNGAYITGKKSSEHSSRSGKYYRAFADEFAHFERSESTLAALTPACPGGLCLGSTPGRTGRYNAFGRIVTSDRDGRGRHFGFKKIELHWSLHPDRTPIWYERETEKLSPEDKAREYDMSLEGAVEARVLPFDRDIHVRDVLDYDPSLPLHLSFDHGLNEETVLFWQVASMQTEEGVTYKQRRILDEYQGGLPVFGSKMTVWDNIRSLKQILCAEPYNLTLADDGKVVGLATCYGDPAGSIDDVSVQRKTDDTKLVSYHGVYRQHGIQITSKFSKIKDGLTLFTELLRADPPKLVVAAKCRNFIEAAINHRHVKDVQTGKVLDRVRADWTKHWCDSARYFIINTSSVRAENAPKAKKWREVWMTTTTGARYPMFVEVT